MTAAKWQKPNHAMHWAPPKWPFLHTCFLSSVVDCAVHFNCLDFLSTSPPMGTHTSVVSWSVLCRNIYITLDYLQCTVSNVLIQPAGVLLIPVPILSVPIMGCAFGVEIGDTSLLHRGLPLDKWSGSVDHLVVWHTSANNLLCGGRYVHSYAKVCLSVSKMEMLLYGNVDFHWTNEVEVFIVAGCSIANASVVEYVSVSGSVSKLASPVVHGALKLATLLCGDVNFHSTNDVEVLSVISYIKQMLRSCCTVTDAREAQYVSVLKLKTVHHSSNSTYRLFSIGHSSISANLWKLIPVECRSPYAASWVEKQLLSLKV